MSELNQRARARVKPVIVAVTVNKPTVVLSQGLTPTPVAVTVTVVTPTVTLV